jgi:hypothetical protein
VFEGHLALRMMGHKVRINGLGSNRDCMKTGRTYWGLIWLEMFTFLPSAIGGRTEMAVQYDSPQIRTAASRGLYKHCNNDKLTL